MLLYKTFFYVKQKRLYENLIVVVTAERSLCINKINKLIEGLNNLSYT